ncbi:MULTISPECIES: hypothetical protein [Brevibacillus]|uniref:hypothetical protein n=1 Tax=Brevibacillus TaxID=55080 RepID=UPI000D104248|nr:MULTISPECIES: hypothetical protein [Brevibacillus]PSJ65922.1 hypothetical protein C7J99_28090 [Brevibacillus brevis]RED27828.1 hypothetical protein DES34_109121 [Brevibacillus brevis]TQK53951.1 hypothetical protein FB479_108166 [Brevibacillus sp. AG162]VEF86866.1 Uncharacterised protein [Brevibacillus brevis]GEC88666.1 hypothetical protein BBR01nite_09970 [Brevibacillus brevis]
MNLKKNKMKSLLAVLVLSLVTSACGTPLPSESTGQVPPQAPQENKENKEKQPENVAQDMAAEQQEKEILVVVDQEPKPIEGNSFDFFIEQLPAGYSLASMQWKSEKTDIVNTIEQAIKNDTEGIPGGNGFYISGNGQFTGFFYKDELKGEKGKLILVFRNEQGNEKTWEKELTLK